MKRSPLFVALSSVVALALGVPALAAPPSALPFDPTPAMKFKPLTVPRLTTKEGAVTCSFNGLCMVPNMPVLHQTDPAVITALAAELTKLVAGTDNPEVADSATGKKAKGVWNDDAGKYYAPTELARIEAGVGCSITVETMLNETIISRMPKTATVVAPGKAYFDANPAPALPRGDSRNVFQYKGHLIWLQDRKQPCCGLTSAPMFALSLNNWPAIAPISYYIGSDGGPSDLEAVKTDFTSVTMDSLAKDVRNGGLIRIMFHWARIGVVKTDDGVTHIIRMNLGNHKVAVRGYSKTIQSAPGVYPIVLNDPGSGTVTSARFTSNLAQYNVAPLNNVSGTLRYHNYDVATGTLTDLGDSNPGWLAMTASGGEPTFAGNKDVGLGKDAAFYDIQFVNAIETTYLSEPKEKNPAARLMDKTFIQLPKVIPGPGPIELRKTVIANPVVKKSG